MKLASALSLAASLWISPMLVGGERGIRSGIDGAGEPRGLQECHARCCGSCGPNRALDSEPDAAVQSQQSKNDERDLAVVVLTFEGVGDQVPVGNFYNGGAGPNYGVSFSPNALGNVDSDAGGSGNFANEPSPSTEMFFLAGDASVMTVSAGFTTGFSFFYSSYNTYGSYTVYDGPDGTGNILAFATLPPTGVSPDGGDPTGFFNIYLPVGVTFSGTAKSVAFGGVANQMGFDDITFGSATPGCQAPRAEIWDPVTDVFVEALESGDTVCLSQYNLRAIPCEDASLVELKLWNTDTKLTVHRQKEYTAPYFLWGDKDGDIYKNAQPLPEGNYSLRITINGVKKEIPFIQDCT